MKKYLLSSLMALSTHSMSAVQAFTERNFMNPKPVSFIARCSTNEKDPEKLIDEIIRFLQEEGLYDAATIALNIKQNLARSTIDAESECP